MTCKTCNGTGVVVKEIITDDGEVLFVESKCPRCNGKGER